jgi:hypothetical protein
VEEKERKPKGKRRKGKELTDLSEFTSAKSHWVRQEEVRAISESLATKYLKFVAYVLILSMNQRQLFNEIVAVGHVR